MSNWEHRRWYGSRCPKEAWNSVRDFRHGFQRSMSIFFMKERWVPCAQKGLIATSTLEGLLFDLDMICNDRQWPDGFVASISTFGLAGFCGAKLGKLSSGNCGDAEGIS